MPNLSLVCPKCNHSLYSGCQKLGRNDPKFIVYCPQCHNGPQGEGESLAEAIQDFDRKHETPTTPTLL